MALTTKMFVIWSLLSALALSNAAPNVESEQPLTCPPCICNVTGMSQSVCTTQPQTSVGYNDEWELVLKASIGVPMNIYDLWMSDSVLNAVNPEAMSISSRYRINYKSASSNNWENIIKVKVSLLKADEEVVFVDFNAV
ncbi:PREDICTED: uncharacterized protein LOC106811368 [Priapulus caudatus]|uniref:Uncharacterized protein LOC106811368 n=1 Tax=Priapulus caudatus TaxID=37621 RepID=A0ABM1EE20_PRICU|nr:PREDICTED: uncharacterized protein LOC106811368 [Priapulus caudatus]